MGWKTELATDIAGWSFAESALKMVENSGRRGFRIPFLGEKTLGFKTGGFLRPSTIAEKTAARWYQKSGLTGFRSAEKRLAAKFGSKVASNAGKRFLLGKAAGIALKGANFVMGATLAYDLTVGGYGMASAIESKYRGLELGGDYQDSMGAATSRQRALQAITASSLQARSAIGNEAMLMHR